MIIFEHVTKRYPGGTLAVDDLSLEVPDGKIMILVGPSGCGKTTTLRMVNRLRSMVFGAPPEFKTRADGQAGLWKHYGLRFKGFDALDESGPITLKAVTDGQVQAADVFTTTPQIITDHLVVLADPKSNFAAQNVLPLVYRKGVNATIANTLNAISARLTTAGLRAMDKAIIVDHANYVTVATAWLKAEGLPS